MKTLILLLLIFCGISCEETVKMTSNEDCIGITAPQSEENKPVEILPNVRDLIPSGYSIVQTKEGSEIIQVDLNNDNRQDAVVLLQMLGDTTYDQAEEVLIMIFTGDRHGQLQMAAVSENLGGESVNYLNTKKLSVKNNVISYYHQSMRHHIILKFRYEKKAGDFMLIGKDYTDYGGMEDGPTAISINYLTKVKLTERSIWDDEKEEVVPVPLLTEKMVTSLQYLSATNWDRMYDDL